MMDTSYHATGCERDSQNETCVVTSAFLTIEGVPFPQVNSCKRIPEAGSNPRTRPKITSLPAEYTLVNLPCGLPEAVPS